MTKGNSNKLFDEVASASRPSGRERKRSSNLLGQRESQLHELTSGGVEDVVYHRVDPARCRMWQRHNRRYDLLNQSRCQDLIDGFLSQGRQEFPAIVRKWTEDEEYDYEVICGARRHWTVTWLRANNYPDFKFLIEVRDLTDEEAFRLSDIENRDREDISDYERAVDYKDALGRYYNTQKEMAKRLEVSEAWLSRYLDLAALPSPVIDAFGDITELRAKHGRDLKPYLKDRRRAERIKKRAKELAAEQKARVEDGRPLLTGATVVKELIESVPGKKAKKAGTLAEYTAPDGGPMLSVTRRGRSGLILRVAPNSTGTKTELVKACQQAIEEFL